MSLDEYNKKRDLKKTGEPEGKEIGKIGGSRLSFVIQKHDARQLHYDFRLEVDGILKSWAIPKGPSTDPEEKRLAIMVEDHPLEYEKFEGVIPEGQYGAGTVIVWDKGHYRNVNEKEGDIVPMDKSIEEGHIEIELYGEKLKGKYALVRTEFREKNEWLMVKMNDEYADARQNPVSTRPESVISGKKNEDFAEK